LGCSEETLARRAIHSSGDQIVRYKRALVALAFVAIASLAVGALFPQALKHEAYSENAEIKPVARHAAAVQTSFYMVVFASEPDSSESRLSHTFATFVKTSRKIGPEEDERLEAVHTISWMPRSLDIVIVRPRPEEGTNLDLPETLRWAESLGARVYVWGPYQIEEELYERARRQESILNSGSVLFKAIDERFRPGPASNCIHAVSDIDMDNGILHVGRQWGTGASRAVVEHLRRWIIAPERTYPSIARKLGLSNSVIPRDLDQQQPVGGR
jgi:hypothetical protein